MSERLQKAGDLVQDLFETGTKDNSSIIEGIFDIENTLNSSIATAKESSEVKYMHEVLRCIISEFVSRNNEFLFDETKLTYFLHTCCYQLGQDTKSRTNTDSYTSIYKKIWKAVSSVLALILIVGIKNKKETKKLKSLFMSASLNNNPMNNFKVLLRLINFNNINDPNYVKYDMEKETRMLINGAVEIIRIDEFSISRRNSLITIAEDIFKQNSIYDKTTRKCLQTLERYETLNIIDPDTVFYVVCGGDIHPGFV